MTRTRTPRKVKKREDEGDDQDGSANGDAGFGDASNRRSATRRTGRVSGRAVYKEESVSDDDELFEDTLPRKKNARKSKVVEPHSSDDDEEDKLKEEDEESRPVRNRYPKSKMREASDSEADNDENDDEDAEDGVSPLSETMKVTDEADVESETEPLESSVEGEEPPPSKKKKISKKPQEKIDPEVEYEVQEILDMRKRGKKRIFKVRWLGFDKKSDTWEKEENLSCTALLDKFLQNQETRVKKEQETGEFEVDRILEVHFKRNGQREFLVRWKGYTGEEDCWVPEENLNCEDLIEKLMEKVNKMRDVPTRQLRSNRQKTDRLANSIIWPTHFGDSSLRHSRRLKGRPRVTYREIEYFDMD